MSSHSVSIEKNHMLNLINNRTKLSVPIMSQETIGERIKRLRERKGLSQEELAPMAHLTKNYIGSLERGGERFSNPTVATIELLARALDVHASEIMFGFSPEDRGYQSTVLIDANNEREVMSAAEKFNQALPLSKEETELVLDYRSVEGKAARNTIKSVLKSFSSRK